MVSEIMKFLAQQDEEVGGAILKEYERQSRNLELIASENIVSEASMLAMGSVLTNKYAEGYPGKRYYGGCEDVDIVENLAIERAKKLFGCDYVNVQPHSGAQANMAVQFAVLQPGDTIMGMNLDQGGHLTHGSPVNMSGKYFNVVPYGVDDQGFLDYDQMRKLALECKPKMIIAGASAYARTIDFRKFREVADEVGAVLMVDMAHIAGLVAAGLHPSPIPYADVVTTTTHKTLRGPRGGMILANKEAAEKFNFNKAIFPGIQGGPLMHVIAAKAVCFGEALKPEFKEYQTQVVKNAKALSAALIEQGFDILTGGTDNHLMLVDLRNMDISGKELQNRCDSAYITLNKNTVPNDPRSPFVTSGVRIGTPAVTTRGLVEEDMKKVAELIKLVATDYEAKADYVRSEVTKICEKYPVYITRDYTVAKKWVRDKVRGSQRCGVLACSSAQRLKPEGIYVQTEIDVKNWFLASSDDLRSSNMMEVVASEFKVQGLEIDWAVVCWDADLRRKNSFEWEHYAFKGTRWMRRNKEEQKRYLVNSYRVLLTRARQGMVLFVPKGVDEEEDPTRNHKYYDDIYDYLKLCGIQEL